MASMTTSPRRRESSQDRGGGWKRVAAVSVVAWVVICGLILAWGWLLTHPLESTIDPADDDVARWFAEQRNPDLTEAADVATYLGETIVGVAIFTLVGLVTSLVRRSWRPILLVGILEAGLGGFYYFSTLLISRDRPPVKVLDPGLVPEHSYPSGHVATAIVCCAGVAVLLWTYFHAVRWVGLVLLLLPVATLLSRLYLGAHHLTDALTSVVYASAWLVVVAGVLLPRRDVIRSGRPSDQNV